MLEIKDRDILKFIDGDIFKSDVKKSIDQWLKADDQNLSDIQIMKTIAHESESLKKYNTIDADAEWVSFASKLNEGNHEPTNTEL